MKIIANSLFIFVLMLLSSLNQLDTTLYNIAMSDIDKMPLKVKVNLPEKIQAGQPCEVVIEIKNISSSEIVVNKRLSVGYQESISRELFITVCHLGSTENVGIQKMLYERPFSVADDYVKLLPDEIISVKFNLFDWYEFPKAGNYSLQVCYQADEQLAYKPDGLTEGIFCSEKIPVTFEID